MNVNLGDMLSEVISLEFKRNYWVNLARPIIL